MLMVILLPIFSSVASGVAEAHKVIQSERSVEILGSEPIEYYPGVMIGIPQHYEVTELSTILYRSFDDISIVFGKAIVQSSSGTLEVYVLDSHSKDGSYAVAVSTILIPGQSGSYVYGETDMVVLSFTPTDRSTPTQEIIIQTFEQTWSQHYSNLRAVVNRLISEYSSSHQPALRSVGNAYKIVIPHLNRLKEVVEVDLKEFDKVMVNPRGTISTFVDPDGYCDSIYLDTGESTGKSNAWISMARIRGTFTSYAAYPSGYGISFSGMTQTAVGGSTAVGMPQGSTISSVSNTKITGVGDIRYTITGSTVLFLMLGWASWTATVYINPLGSSSFPARVALSARASYDSLKLAEGYLKLC